MNTKHTVSGTWDWGKGENGGLEYVAVGIFSMPSMTNCDGWPLSLQTATSKPPNRLAPTPWEQFEI